MTTQSAAQCIKTINTLYNYYAHVGITEEADKWVTVDLQLVDKPNSIDRVIWSLFAYLYNITGWGYDPLEMYKLSDVVTRFESFLNQHVENIQDDILQRAEFIKQVLTVIKFRKDPSLECLKLINTIPRLLNSAAKNEIVTEHREVFEELQKRYFKVAEVSEGLFSELKKIGKCVKEFRGKVSTIGLLNLPGDIHRKIIAEYLSLQDFIALQGTCTHMRAYREEEKLWQENIRNSMPSLLSLIENKPSKKQFCLTYLQFVHGIQRAQSTLCVRNLPHLGMMRVPNYQIAATEEAIFAVSSSEEITVFDSVTGKELCKRKQRTTLQIVDMVTTPEAVFMVYRNSNGTCCLYEWQKGTSSPPFVTVPIMELTLYHGFSYEKQKLYIVDGLQLRRWDMIKGKELDPLSVPRPNRIGTVQTYFFAEETGANNRDLRISNLMTKDTKIFNDIGGHAFIEAQGSTLYFQSPSSVHEIVAYDFASGNCVGTFRGCNAHIKTVVIHNGILFALADYAIIAWDQGTGAFLRNVVDADAVGMCYRNGKLYYRDIYDRLYVIDFFK